MQVAVLGASPKPERYAYRAMKMLIAHGHTVLLVNPGYKDIEGQSCYPSLAGAGSHADTITMYLSPPHITAEIKADILAASPRRVIFNPGTENPELAKALRAAGIEVVEACTLVMLSTRQF